MLPHRDKAGRQLKKKREKTKKIFFCLFGFLTSSSTTRLYRGRAPRQERLTILRAATHETELGDHDFCLSRSHYTDTDPTCRERAATAGIKPGTSSPGVARSTAELPRPPDEEEEKEEEEEEQQQQQQQQYLLSPHTLTAKLPGTSLCTLKPS